LEKWVGRPRQPTWSSPCGTVTQRALITRRMPLLGSQQEPTAAGWDSDARPAATPSGRGGRQRGVLPLVGDVLDALQGAGEEVQQRGALVGVKSLEHLVLDGVHALASARECLAPGIGDLHAVAAAVLGVTATDHISGVLELVE